MQPIDPGEDKGELVTYGAGQAEYEPLPSRVGLDYDGNVASLTLWQLSEDERRAILDGARLGLRVLTFGRPLQPVYLYIEGTERDPFVPEVEDA